MKVITAPPFSKAATKARRLLAQGVPQDTAITQAGLPLATASEDLAAKIASIISVGKTDKETRKEFVTSRLVQLATQDEDLDLSRKAVMDLAKIDGMYQDGGFNALFELHPDTRLAMRAAGPVLDVTSTQEESTESEEGSTGDSSRGR